MFDRMWDSFVDILMVTFMPLVCAYFAITTSVFLNVAAQDATGLEKAGNTLLAPVQYILAAKEAIQKSDGSWQFVQKFDYTNKFWIKTTASVIALPPSLVLGSAVKGLSYLTQKTKVRHDSMIASIESTKVHSNVALYEQMGLKMEFSPETLVSLGAERKPGDENTLRIEKEGLKEIGKLLTAANISWWVDCGTCLGAYRYGGVIPWDGDIDIAVLLPDFANVRHALNSLDSSKYVVQDWSSRDHPNSYIKVYIKESRSLIDIYHFAIDSSAKNLHYIFALENNIFFPEWWKIREKRFKVPVAFDTVFPLRKALFDGIEVNVPNDIVKYLQRYYGDNLAPAKIYDATTGRYEKDLNHPYWQRVYVH
jgi:hypothetical protein